MCKCAQKNEVSVVGGGERGREREEGRGRGLPDCIRAFTSSLRRWVG